jgi:hypothetical protein
MPKSCWRVIVSGGVGAVHLELTEHAPDAIRWSVKSAEARREAWVLVDMK